MLEKNIKLLKDSLIFIVSIAIAWWLLKFPFLQQVIESLLPFRFLAEVIAGVLYASFLTSPISVAALIVLARDGNPIITALLAGGGAVLGDFLIVKFLKKKQVATDLLTLSKDLRVDILYRYLKKIHLDFIVPIIAAIIIASPLPDELGLALLDGVKYSYRDLAVISYILNTAGILVIVVPANLLS